MGKVGGWIVWPVEDPSGPGGRRARTARTKHGRGPFAPPMLWFAGCRKSGLRHFFEVFIAPLRLRRGQGAMQGNPCYARLFADLTRMSPNPIKASGGCGPRTPGGFSTGWVFRAGAFGPGPKNKPAAGQSPVAGGWAQPTRRRPPSATFSANAKKATQKPGPTLYGRALKPRQEGSRQRFRPLGQSRCPCPTGSGGFIRPTAGYRLQTTSPRCCATPAARVGPPCA